MNWKLKINIINCKNNKNSYICCSSISKWFAIIFATMYRKYTKYVEHVM